MTESAIKSPCINVCAVDAQTGYCLGCGRTMGEIGGWVKLGTQGRAQVLAQLPKRMEALTKQGKLGPVQND